MPLDQRTDCSSIYPEVPPQRQRWAKYGALGVCSLTVYNGTTIIVAHVFTLSEVTNVMLFIYSNT